MLNFKIAPHRHFPNFRKISDISSNKKKKIYSSSPSRSQTFQFNVEVSTATRNDISLSKKKRTDEADTRGCFHAPRHRSVLANIKPAAATR